MAQYLSIEKDLNYWKRYIENHLKSNYLLKDHLSVTPDGQLMGAKPSNQSQIKDILLKKHSPLIRSLYLAEILNQVPLEFEKELNIVFFLSLLPAGMSESGLLQLSDYNPDIFGSNLSSFLARINPQSQSHVRSASNFEATPGTGRLTTPGRKELL